MSGGSTFKVKVFELVYWYCWYWGDHAHQLKINNKPEIFSNKMILNALWTNRKVS